MNTGIIASRYASALLKYSVGNGDEDAVYRQALILDDAFSRLPEFSRIVSTPLTVSDSEKMSLMRSAIPDGKMADSLDRFLQLVIRNGRISFLRFILHSFVSKYYGMKGIVTAELVTCVPSPELENRLKELAASVSGEKLLMRTRQDPSLIGGFIFEMNGLRVDASISRQLGNIRKMFNEKNRRIV